jgi:hypothetical protein
MVAVPERHPAWAANVREVAATITQIGQVSWAVCLGHPFTPCKGNTIHFAINAGSRLRNKTSNEDGSLGEGWGCVFSTLNFITINSFKNEKQPFLFPIGSMPFLIFFLPASA